MLKNKAVK